MSFGKMNKTAYLKRHVPSFDTDGFDEEKFEIVASFRVYREGRHGSERWANLSAFSSATDLFRFRTIQNVEINTDMIFTVDGTDFNILSLEDVKGRGVYTEILAKKVE